MSAAVQQAVILAAGRGSRLGAEGAHLPKCLLPVAGRPMLAWTAEALRDCGVHELRIVAGWQAQAVQAWSADTVVNTRWADTGVLRSLLLADPWLQQAPALVAYGDGIYGRAALHRVLHAPDADLLVPGDRLWHALWSRRFAAPLDDAESWRGRDGWLEDIGARASAVGDVAAQFMGLLRIMPRGWQTLRAHVARWESADGAAAIDRMDMTGLLRRLLDEGVRIACVEVEGGWVEIDSLSDRQAVEHALREPGFTHEFR